MSNTRTRHVGKLKNTGQRCVVVFRQIPTEENSALIVQSDQLPDQYHDNLMHVLKSDAAQQTNDLYEVLARRKFGDGTHMLECLHQKNFLKKVPVSEVILYPYPNHPLPLADANMAIAELESNNSQPQEAFKPVSDPAFSKAPEVTEDASAIAASKLAQAQVLEADVNRLREEAYKLDPSLRPSRGRPELSEEEKERRREEHNRKRREKYRAEKEAKVTEESTVPDPAVEGVDTVSTEQVLEHLARKQAEKDSGGE